MHFKNVLQTFSLQTRFLCPCMVMFVVENTSAQQRYDYQTQGLNEHNRLRALHGAPDIMTLDDELIEIAEKCAEYVAELGYINHSCPHKNSDLHDENLFGGVVTQDYTKAVMDGIKVSYDQIQNYNFNNQGFTTRTGHFTQLVWRSSTRLGIGASWKDGRIFVAAIYFPAGNVGGQYQSNVFPRQ